MLLEIILPIFQLVWGDTLTQVDSNKKGAEIHFFVLNTKINSFIKVFVNIPTYNIHPYYDHSDIRLYQARLFVSYIM